MCTLDGLSWPQRLALADPGIDEAAWRRAVDPDDAGLFTRRLTWPSVPLVPTTVSPDWRTELDILRSAMQPGLAPDPALGGIPFERLLSPLVTNVWDRLLGQVPELSAWSPSAQAALRKDLAARIAGVTTDAFYADFSAARTTGGGIAARLGWSDGADSRYRRWCDDQARDGLTHLLASFPVLGRLLAVTTGTWTTATAMMAQRLHHHRDEMATLFGIAPEAPVVAVTPGLSDPHRGGHRVAILGFEDGNRIVYKPKDLRLERWFSRVAGTVMGTQDLIVLCGDGYGFTSVIDHRPCPPSELPHFYATAGRLCALLYLLGATDAHYENLIAHGHGLTLIDSETLFHVDLEQANPWSETVLRTGMLPAWTLIGSLQRVGDQSALGASVAPRAAVSGWLHLNTDDVTRAAVTREAPAPLSSPVAVGQPNPLRDHVEDLVRGFREFYLDHRVREFLRAALAEVRGLPQRVVLRNTRVYAVVQQQATRAEALTSGQARGMHLEQLSRAALVRGEPSPLWDVFHAELDEMENLDIPYFSHDLGGSDVDSARGVIPGMITHDPLRAAAARLHRSDDVDWQEFLIRAAVRARFATADMRPAARRGPLADRNAPTCPETGGVGRGTSQPLTRHTNDHADDGTAAHPQHPRRGGSIPPTPAGLLAAIDAAALPDGTWVTHSRMPDGRHVRLGLIGDGWYDGRAGVWAVQSAAGDPHAADTLRPVFTALSQPDPYDRFRFLRNLGLGFAGVGGLLRCEATRSQVLALLPRDLVTRDRILDFTGGVAGLIGPLALTGSPLLQDAASTLAAAQLPSGGWESHIGPHPLTGLAHGAAGMGLALLQAGTAAGREDWIDAGARAFAYEDRLFADGNWPDLRRPGASPMVAWCHGAPGIGLTRLLALGLLPQHRDAGRWSEDLRAAMRTTATAALPATDHLCCGLCGRAAVLRICGRTMGEPDWVAAADDLTDALLDGYRHRGSFVLPLDEPGGPASPGLMTGLAGIAAHLLSLQTGADLSGYLL